MTETILILIAGLLALSVICPFAEAYSKWKKEMESDDNVQD